MSDEELIDYTDPDIIARQNIAPNAGCNIDGKFYDVRNLVHLASSQADHIKALTVESARRLALARSEGVARVEQFERTEALTEQLDAARQDAEEAEAYAEELEKERDDYAHKLMQANNTYTEMHLEIERLSDKLAKAVEDLQDMLTIPNSEAAQGILKAYARALIAELTGGKDD